MFPQLIAVVYHGSLRDFKEVQHNSVLYRLSKTEKAR